MYSKKYNHKFICMIIKQSLISPLENEFLLLNSLDKILNHRLIYKYLIDIWFIKNINSRAAKWSIYPILNWVENLRQGQDWQLAPELEVHIKDIHAL